MKLLESGEVFEEVNIEHRYSYAILVYRDGQNIYQFRSRIRIAKIAQITAKDLTDKAEMAFTVYAPLAPSEIPRAPDLLPATCNTESPKLASCGRPPDDSGLYPVAEDMLEEVKICELLEQHPHPNMARYTDCRVTNGLIRGIGFERYSQTLAARANTDIM